MAEEEQQQVDENKRIRPRERARGQKTGILVKIVLQKCYRTIVD